MVVYDAPKMVISANQATPSTFIRLGKGEHRVDIEYSSGGSGTVTPKQTTNPNNTSALQEITKDGTAIAATGSTSFIIAGPICIGCIVATLSGSITVMANKIED